MAGAGPVAASADSQTEAARLQRLGVEQNLAGHPARAIKTLRRALALLDASAEDDGRTAVTDPAVGTLIARIWISLATSESELDGLSAGLAVLARAEHHVARLSDRSLDVIVQNQLGFMLVRGGHVEEGLRHLDRAVGLLAYADPKTSHAILLNRGTTHLFRGDLTRARADLHAATETAVQHSLAVDEVKSRHNLGYLEFLAGNLAAALHTMDEVLAVEADFSRAVVLLDRSRVLIEAGLHSEADVSLREADGLFRAERLWKDVAEAELARAECALLDGEFGAARRLAASARNRFRRRGNDRWRRDAELVLLQGDLAVGRPGARLVEPALRLAADYRSNGLSTRARTAQLLAAEALLAADQVPRATEVARLAGPLRSRDPIAARLHTRAVRAKLQLSNGRLSQTRSEIRKGLAELSRHQAQFGSIDLQTASAVHGRQLAELDLSLALRAGRPRGVLAAAERSRATSSRVQSVVAPKDQQVAALLAELRQLAEELRAIESDGAAFRLVAVHRRRMAVVQGQLRSRAWAAEGSRTSARGANFDETVAAARERHCTYICYLEVAGQLHALVLGERGNVVHDLGPAAPMRELVLRVRADLDVLARGQLPAVLREAVTGSLRRSLVGLEAGLIAPLQLALDRVVIAPSGVLATLPWGMLPSLRGCPITVSPSATAWLKASRTPNPSRPSKVAAFAGPDLAFAEAEVAQIGQIWAVGGGADGTGGASALRADFYEAMTTCDLVHVAAHGVHQAENPLFSSIRLADGPLYAYELDSSRPAAGHVVLSACELGQATMRPGDEALGLTSVLLRLGTQSVISGVARVNDQVASEVMVRYHRELAAGRDSAEALASAAADQSQSSGLPAPFVCFGAAWRAGPAAAASMPINA